MHAILLELYKDFLTSGIRFLDAGCGSGYLTCAFAYISQGGGFSYGIDHIKQLSGFVDQNIRKNHAEMLDSGKVNFSLGDVREGLAEFAPYNVIHLGMSVKQVPRRLLGQLAPGGRMIAPLDLD